MAKKQQWSLYCKDCRVDCTPEQRCDCCIQIEKDREEG
jgi:hypothetical protein